MMAHMPSPFTADNAFGWPEQQERTRIHIPDARQWLDKGLREYCGENAVLTLPHVARDKNGSVKLDSNGNAVKEDTYDEIAKWMDDNDGRGLLCIGGCGLGKTVICSMILPRLINWYSRLGVKVYNSSELNQKYKEIADYGKTPIVIDDIGLEHRGKVWGEDLGYVFSGIVDDAEKSGRLLILTSNLKPEEIYKKYGERTYDRLLAIVKWVKFEGKSFRK